MLLLFPRLFYYRCLFLLLMLGQGLRNTYPQTWLKYTGHLMDFEDSQHDVLPWKSMTPVVRGLFGVTAFTFFLQILLQSAQLTSVLELSRENLGAGQFWTLLTYMFAHNPEAGGTIHLLFNMLWLGMLGSILEREIGSRAFLVLYLLAGLLGGFVHVMVSPSPAIGAFGAVTGVVVALVALHPSIFLQIMVLPPMRVWALGMIYLVTDLSFYLMSLDRPDIFRVSYDVNVVGALVGFLFLVLLFQPAWWRARFVARHGGGQTPNRERRRVRRPAPTLEAPKFEAMDGSSGSSAGPSVQAKQRKPQAPGSSVPSEAEVNRVLDKLSNVGLANLDDAERRILEKAAEERNRP